MELLTSLLLFIAVALAVRLWRWERSPFVHCIDKIPGPPRVSFFGNFFNVPRDGPGLLQTFIVKWPSVYGPVYRFWRGMSPIINISSVSDIEKVLSSQKHINKSITGDFYLPWLGYGLLLAVGNKWRKDRKLLTPAFHFQILDGFFDVFNRNANIFVELINKKRMEQREVDIYPMTSRCTLDIICEAAMGIQIDAQIKHDSKYITAIANVEIFLTKRVNSVRGLLPDWFYYRFTSHGRELQTYLDIVHSFTRKVMLDRKSQIEQNPDEGNDEDNQSGKKKRRAFLDLLLEAARQGADLSEADIISQVDTFMFEGHDTTSAAITWFLYCMVTHQDEQDRVYEEIKEVFGDSSRPCTLEDLSKLKYLDCCMKESLRLYPPVSFIRRRMSEDVRFSGYLVPEDTSVSILIYTLHRNEEFFPEPHSFKPERFQTDQTVGRNPFAYVPFSAGPRNCIGQKFATYEDKVILTTLLRNFHFDIDSSRVPIKESLNLILKPEGGMPLLISSRR